MTPESALQLGEGSERWLGSTGSESSRVLTDTVSWAISHSHSSSAWAGCGVGWERETEYWGRNKGHSRRLSSGQPGSELWAGRLGSTELNKCQSGCFSRMTEVNAIINPIGYI